ncbi:MAG: flavodoxin, partial [Marmoricola sp.]|nr:flavodoxin [Marmoricola sp.]
SITGALGWAQGYAVLEAMGEVTGSDTESAYELGGTIAALLDQ